MSADILTPDKYYGGQLDNNEKCKYLIGCDWLEMSLRGEMGWLTKLDEYERGEYRLMRNPEIRSRFFNHAYNVYIRNEFWGTLLFAPRSAVIPVECVQLKIDNQQFYKRGNRLNSVIKTFLGGFELEFHNYTRVDLYIDFHRFNPSVTFESFVTAYGNGQIESRGRVESWDLFHTKIGGEMTLTGFNYGSRSSDKFIRCYCKSIELEKVHKPYILNYWKQNSFEAQNVYRFEIQLNSKWFRKTKGYETGCMRPMKDELKHKFFDVVDKRSLVNLMQLAMDNYFDFFIQDETVVRNDDKVPFMLFDWDHIMDGLNQVYNYVREKIEHQKVTWRQKMLVVRNLFREYLVNYQDPGWLRYAARIAYDYQLQSRWEKMWLNYVFEFKTILGITYEIDLGKCLDSWNHFIGEFKANDLQPHQVELQFVPVQDTVYTRAYSSETQRIKAVTKEMIRLAELEKKRYSK